MEKNTEELLKVSEGEKTLVPAPPSTLGSSKGLPVRVTSRTAGTAGYLLSWDSSSKEEGAWRALLGS